MNVIEEINHILGQRQIENILYTIKIINNRDFYRDKIEKMKYSNIQKCIKWCEEHNIPINKLNDITNTKNIFLK